MFASLFYLSLCSNRITVAPPEDPSKTSFDLLFTPESGQQLSATNKKGYYVAIRIYNSSGSPGELQFLKWNNTHELEVRDQFRLSLRFEDDREPTNQKVYFLVQNFQERPLRFDLGVFCDADFSNEGDNVKLQMVLNGRAVMMSSDEAKSITHILIGTYYHNVDTIYLGSLSNDKLSDPKSFPFFDDSRQTTSSNDDTVLAFSWKNRTIPAQQSDEFGFIAIVGKQYKLQPFVYDLTEKREQYPKQVNLVFELVEYDAQEATLIVSLNGSAPQEYKFTSDGNTNISHNFTIPIDFGDGLYYSYSVKARDADGYLSDNPIEKTLIAIGANRPVVEITTKFEEYYYPEDHYIYVEGTVKDEKAVTVYYQFDEREKMKESKHYTSFGEDQLILNADFPTKNFGLNQRHILKIWGEDDLGLSSFVTTVPFNYSSDDRPSIPEVYLSHERVPYKNKTLAVLFGKATDPDVGQELKIIAQIDDQGNEVVIGRLKATADVSLWAYFLHIPKTLDPGYHTVHIWAEDGFGKKSKEIKNLKFKVVDPDAPAPQSEYGQIKDVSRNLQNGNTLFNLHYIGTDKTESEMSYNDEGFYVGFRAHEGVSEASKPLEKHIYKKSDGRRITKDNFTVAYSSGKDLYDKTGFLQVKFAVTNNNDFEKRFDLGVYVDSDFSGDDNSSIAIRKDGRGIVVSNDKKNLHYTIVTRDYSDAFPDVANHYLKEIQRSDDGTLPIDKIPFFKTSLDKAFSGTNAMFGFSWSVRVRSGETKTLGVVFAGHDKINTPSRIIDETIYKDVYHENDQQTFKFRVKDGDFGQKMQLIINVNRKKHETVNFTIKSNEDFTYTTTLTINTYITISASVKDLDPDFKIETKPFTKTIRVNNPPTLEITSPLKDRYHEKESIILAGTSINDDRRLQLKYCFYDIDGAQSKVYTKTLTTGSPFNYSIDFGSDSVIYPRDDPWNITVWTVDNYQAESQPYSKLFYLKPYNPPILRKAGFAKKSVTAGDSVLAFVVLNDLEKSWVDIYAKIGEEAQYGKYLKRYQNTEDTTKDKPVAFRIPVPRQLKPGVYEVHFKVVDSENLESREYLKTIIITQ